MTLLEDIIKNKYIQNSLQIKQKNTPCFVLNMSNQGKRSVSAASSSWS